MREELHSHQNAEEKRDVKGVDFALRRAESRSKKRVRTVEAVERESAHEGTI